MAIIKRCPKCGIVLYKDYLNPDYFKLFGKDKLHILIDKHGHYCKKCGYISLTETKESK